VTPSQPMHPFEEDPRGLMGHISRLLHEKSLEGSFFPRGISASLNTSAVLFLLSTGCPHGPGGNKPCLVLNKRSAMVRQPGDLCFPGGSVSPRLDTHFSRILRLPFFPLGRWPHWRAWRNGKKREARRLSLLLAASLRESFEEMRLNPLGVKFLGPLPPQSLEMFNRVIYPMVGWLGSQRRFLPNWEVDKIVTIPLFDLLDESRYGCYRLSFDMGRGGADGGNTQEFLCFIHRQDGEQDVLWGATFRIILVFMEMIFGFRPPDARDLPVVYRSLGDNYLSGER